MSKNIILNGQTYSGVSEVKLPVSGGTAKFKDEDEIPAAPSGTKQITTNGNGIDVTNYAAVDVNVQGGGDTPTYQEKTVTANGVVTPDAGYDALSKVTVNVSGGSPIPADWEIDSGNFTPTTDITSAYSVTHNLGKIPSLIYVYADAIDTLVNGDVESIGRAYTEKAYGYMLGVNILFGNARPAVSSKFYYCIYKGITKLNLDVNADTALLGGTPTTTTFNVYGTSSASAPRILKAGVKYNWKAIYIPD